MTGHTPWRFERKGCKLFDGHDRKIADMSPSWLDENELQARGALIAAAPELLAACNHVIEWLGEPELENSDNAHPAFRKALTKCRNAIAKTTAS